jgi:hypothetical protein
MAKKIVKDSQCLVNDLANDCISRQAAIDAVTPHDDEYRIRDVLEDMPSVEVIPVEWIERKIARLKEMDNAFASLTANQIMALLNDWRTEQNEG